MNESVIERQALIFNKQKYNMYDGPGIRTMVFFKGCPLRCKWCANPEGLERGYGVMFTESLCINCGECAKVCPVGIHKMTGPNGSHEIDRSIACIGCRKCEKACMPKALSIVGDKKNISELLDYVEEDRTFYEVSGGGMTLGGGEVTMQPEAAQSLLMSAKQAGLNTAIETCGYVKKENLLKMADFVDTFLFDIKQIDPEKHSYWTGVRNERILENLQELLDKRYNVQIRMPLLKGVNDAEEDIKGVIKFLTPYKDYKNFKGIDLLPYHRMGVNKYKQMGMDYPMDKEVGAAATLTEEDIQRIEGYFEGSGLNFTTVRH